MKNSVFHLLLTGARALLGVLRDKTGRPFALQRFQTKRARYAGVFYFGKAVCLFFIVFAATFLNPFDAFPQAGDLQEADLQALVSGNNEFALDLFQAIREEEGNLFVSPYSISLALAMAYAGARNETARHSGKTRLSGIN